MNGNSGRSRAIGRASGQSHAPERHFCRQHLGDKVIGNVGQFHHDLIVTTFRGEHLDARGLKVSAHQYCSASPQKGNHVTPIAQPTMSSSWEPVPPVVSSLPDSPSRRMPAYCCSKRAAQRHRQMEPSRRCGPSSAGEWNWGETSTIQSATGRATAVPRGRGVGGSTAINAMIFARGHRASYAAWEDAGAKGWNFDALLPTSSEPRRLSAGTPRCAVLTGR